MEEPYRQMCINLTFPTCWEALTFHEFRDVCEILSLELDRETTLVYCLFKLAHLKLPAAYRYDSMKMTGKIPATFHGSNLILGAETIAEGCEQISFIYDSVGLAPAPFENVHKKLYDTSFGDFFEADSLIMRAAVEKNPKWLDLAARCLTKGKRKKLVPWEQKAILIWWNGLKDDLMSRFPYALEPGNGISGQTQEEILQQLLSCMNGNKPQENDDILETDMYSVLTALNNIYRDVKQRISMH